MAAAGLVLGEDGAVGVVGLTIVVVDNLRQAPAHGIGAWKYPGGTVLLFQQLLGRHTVPSGIRHQFAIRSHLGLDFGMTLTATLTGSVHAVLGIRTLGHADLFGGASLSQDGGIQTLGQVEKEQD